MWNPIKFAWSSHLNYCTVQTVFCWYMYECYTPDLQLTLFPAFTLGSIVEGYYANLYRNGNMIEMWAKQHSRRFMSFHRKIFMIELYYEQWWKWKGIMNNMNNVSVIKVLKSCLSSPARESPCSTLIKVQRTSQAYTNV